MPVRQAVSGSLRVHIPPMGIVWGADPEGAAMAPITPYQHPAWYGSVMGTGALALALAGQGAAWSLDWLSQAGGVMLVVASVLAVVLLPRYIKRAGTPTDLTAELSDPGHGAMLSTLPAGLLVLATAWGRIGPEFIPAGIALWTNAVLVIIGALLATVLGIWWSTLMLRATPQLEGVNGGWLIPPVMNMLVPLPMAALISANPDLAPSLLLVAFVFYGIGVILFLAIMTLLIARLALRDPLPAQMAPSLWIPLAPAGMIGLALLRLQQAAMTAGVPGYDGIAFGMAVAAMGVGFGLWWALFAWIELRKIRSNGGPPLHPGWWGFVFPIGAMTLSITAIATASDIGWIKVIGAVATALLALVWILIAIRTTKFLKPTTRSV